MGVATGEPRLPRRMVRVMRVVLAAAAAALVAAAAASAHPGPVGPASSAVERLAWTGRPVFCGGPRKRLFALTIDDGPGPWTEGLLAVLRRKHAPATFFLVGNRVPRWQSSALAEAAYGAVGNHTWSHPRLNGLRPRRVEQELLWTQEELWKRLRVRSLLFRPPYGRAAGKTARVVHSLGLLDVRWNVDPGDSLPGARPARVARAAAAALKPGAIVILHDSHPWTAKVVRAVLAAAKRKHLRPVTVPELLRRDPPDPSRSCYA
jgi:peptidoglycan/xylan/chitin deacetylase (PgdA/CDA1 family)